LPLVTSVTEDALRNLPPGYRLGSLGMGASHWQTIWYILLPACFPRIMTGLIMAAGRGFGEAAALMFTAGMSTDIDWTDWDVTSPSCPLNPIRPGETLALNIWAMRTEALQANAAQLASVSSAVLMLLVVSFSLAARYLSWRIDKRMSGGR
jgi:phosphate transport system permease protein